MLLNKLNRDMFKICCSHRGLLGKVFGCVLEDLHKFYRGSVQREASMRALWSCLKTLNVSDAFLTNLGS